MINLHGCITVYKEKKEGNLAKAGHELMVTTLSPHCQLL